MDGAQAAQARACVHIGHDDAAGSEAVSRDSGGLVNIKSRLLQIHVPGWVVQVMGQHGGVIGPGDAE